MSGHEAISASVKVLRHFDATLNASDLQKIGQLSSSACPPGSAKLCRDLQAALKHIPIDQ